MSINISWKNLKLTDPDTGALILKDLEGSVDSGNFVSIMGPSGAGKSSLLSILTCRLRKDNSKLQIEGETHPP
jgi:putative ABC transport system ATP-binding protein